MGHKRYGTSCAFRQVQRSIRRTLLPLSGQTRDEDIELNVVQKCLEGNGIDSNEIVSTTQIDGATQEYDRNDKKKG